MLDNLQILVVDDDVAILQTVTAYLQDLGHRVIARENAVDAMDALCGTPCDLMLVDVNLVGLSGLELARMARDHKPDIAIIVMTAFDEMFPLSVALKAGADGYLNKPFNLKTLGLIFERAYWETLSRMDWWEKRVGMDGTQ